MGWSVYADIHDQPVFQAPIFWPWPLDLLKMEDQQLCCLNLDQAVGSDCLTYVDLDPGCGCQHRVLPFVWRSRLQLASSPKPSSPAPYCGGSIVREPYQKINAFKKAGRAGDEGRLQLHFTIYTFSRTIVQNKDVNATCSDFHILGARILQNYSSWYTYCEVSSCDRHAFTP